MYCAVSVGIILGSFFILAAQENVPDLKIEVLEGDGAINSIRLKRGHAPAVRLTDLRGQAVEGATVTFTLPSAGASGVFANGLRSFTAQTDGQGRAVGEGLRPNAIEGQFKISVTAMSHGARGTVTLVETNADPVLQSRHTKLIIIIAAVAGAAAAGAVSASRGGGSSATSAASPGGTISAGTPTFGPPH
jgi:hypothetical protein